VVSSSIGYLGLSNVIFFQGFLNALILFSHENVAKGALDKTTLATCRSLICPMMSKLEIQSRHLVLCFCKEQDLSYCLQFWNTFPWIKFAWEGSLQSIRTYPFHNVNCLSAVKLRYRITLDRVPVRFATLYIQLLLWLCILSPTVLMLISWLLCHMLWLVTCDYVWHDHSVTLVTPLWLCNCHMIFPILHLSNNLKEKKRKRKEI